MIFTTIVWTGCERFAILLSNLPPLPARSWCTCSPAFRKRSSSGPQKNFACDPRRHLFYWLKHYASKEKSRRARTGTRQDGPRVWTPARIVGDDERDCPLAYNKDLQEDKEAIFDTVKTVSGCLESMTILLQEGHHFS